MAFPRFLSCVDAPSPALPAAFQYHPEGRAQPVDLSCAQPQPAGEAIPKFTQIRSFEDFVDYAVALPESQVTKYVHKLRAQNPQADTAQLMEILSKRYIRWSATASAGVGGGSAIPGSGLVMGTALSAVELAFFATSTSLYVLAMAQLAQVPIAQKQLRRALILSAVLGEDASKILTDQFGIDLWKWARERGTGAAATSTLSSVNLALVNYANKKLAKKLSAHALGRVIPLGIGAAIGYFSGRKLASQTVSGVRAQLSQL